MIILDYLWLQKDVSFRVESTKFRKGKAYVHRHSIYAQNKTQLTLVALHFSPCIQKRKVRWDKENGIYTLKQQSISLDTTAFHYRIQRSTKHHTANDTMLTPRRLASQLMVMWIEESFHARQATEQQHASKYQTTTSTSVCIPYNNQMAQNKISMLRTALKFEMLLWLVIEAFWSYQSTPNYTESVAGIKTCKDWTTLWASRLEVCSIRNLKYPI